MLAVALLAACFPVAFAVAGNPATSGAKIATSSLERYVSPAGNDGNDGSAKRPWATLKYAAGKVKPGSIVHVAPGTYSGPISTSISGISVARIKFISDVKWGAVVRSTGAPSTWTNDGSFVDIIGFDISGDGYLGLFNRGSNVRIIANHVHHVAAAGCTGNGGAGILNGNYAAMDNDVIGNVVHDIGEPRTSCSRVQGIYHSNLRGHILNNIAFSNQGYGIHLWHAAAEVTIANNLVFNNRHGGILIGSGDVSYGASPRLGDYMTVVNNIVIYNQNRYGVEEMGVTGPHNQYLNNLVFGNHIADWKLLTGKQSGTINEDPHLLNFRADGSGDYHLSSNSPALGRGTSLNAPTFDMEGYARPRSGAWDIGPYQSGTPLVYPYPPDVCNQDCTTVP